MSIWYQILMSIWCQVLMSIWCQNLTSIWLRISNFRNLKKFIRSQTLTSIWLQFDMVHFPSVPLNLINFFWSLKFFFAAGRKFIIYIYFILYLSFFAVPGIELMTSDSLCAHKTIRLLRLLRVFWLKSNINQMSPLQNLMSIWCQNSFNFDIKFSSSFEMELEFKFKSKIRVLGQNLKWMCRCQNLIWFWCQFDIKFWSQFDIKIWCQIDIKNYYFWGKFWCQIDFKFWCQIDIKNWSQFDLKNLEKKHKYQVKTWSQFDIKIWYQIDFKIKSKFDIEWFMSKFDVNLMSIWPV